MAESFGLTPEKRKEFKDLAVQEFGDAMVDDEIRDMAIRLLSLYSVLYNESHTDGEPRMSKTDIVAFAYISAMLRDYNHSQTVRELSRFPGRNSSRTGQRVLDHLIVEGLMERGRDGRLRFGDRAEKVFTCLGRQEMPSSRRPHF